MEEPDLMDLPEPVEYHDHGGEEVPVYRVYSPIQEPGKEPEDIAFGLLCVVCGFTPTPRVPLKRRNRYISLATSGFTSNWCFLIEQICIILAATNHCGMPNVEHC